MVADVQAVLFDVNKWNILGSHLWLQKRSIFPIKSPHVTDKFIRYRIQNPDKYDRLKTKHITPTVQFIIGYR